VAKHRTALDRLLAGARSLATKHRADAVAWRCKGLESLSAVFAQLESATDAADLPILESILTAIEQFEERGERHHPFVEWIAALVGGESSLPRRIPRSLLVAWTELNPVGAPPIVMMRCAGCKLALPWRGGTDWPGWSACPACDGASFEVRDLSRDMAFTPAA
jgi:hypothetical protein